MGMGMGVGVRRVMRASFILFFIFSVGGGGRERGGAIVVLLKYGMGCNWFFSRKRGWGCLLGAS